MSNSKGMLHSLKMDDLEVSSKYPRMGLNNEDFKEAAKYLIQYIVKYHDEIKDRRPFPNVKPGKKILLILFN